LDQVFNGLFSYEEDTWAFLSFSQQARFLENIIPFCFVSVTLTNMYLRCAHPLEFFGTWELSCSCPEPLFL